MLFFKSKKTKFLESVSWYLIKIAKDLYKVSIIVFIVYFLLEQFKTGLISNYFDINYLLAVAIFSGLIGIVLTEADGDRELITANKNLVIQLAIVFILGLFIFQRLHNFGLIAMIISVLSALSILIIISSNLNEYD